MDPYVESPLVCPRCGLPHRHPRLRRGERAHCSRCGETLALRSWWGRDAALPFALAGLALALPAALEPFVTLGKFGREFVSSVSDPARGFWHHGMFTLGAWTWACGVLAPFALLLLLLVLTPSRAGHETRTGRLAAQIAVWSMPEVQVLGILVSFFKLGDVVEARIGPGFWCYAVGSACLVLAWRQHMLVETPAAASRRTTP